MNKGIQLTNATFAKPKVQKLQLLKGIANIIKDVGTAATGGLAGLPADIIDTISAIKLEDKPETIGWKLISRSLVDAIVTLVAETGRGFFKDEIETAHLDKDLNKFLEKQEYFISKTFLKDPESLKLLQDIEPLLDEFLEIFGFNKAERNNLLERLGRYFLASLIAEWRANVQYYAVLKAVLETPFDEAEQRASEWNVYGNHLVTQIHKPVFSESFSLAQIYIPLRAEYKTINKKDNSRRERLEELPGHKEGKFTRHAVDIEKHLLKWINDGNHKDALRIVRGGPGNGKSSFLKMLAARLIEENKPVLFIPLHRLDLEGKLDVTVNNFLRYDKFFSYDPINDDDKPLILIFDGLDELAMQGKALIEVAQRFIREVERSLSGYNANKLKLKVIISGRDVIIQQNESEFREDGQVLKLLPYYLTGKEQEELKGTQKLIAQDQRHDWWKRYSELKGKGHQELPENLRTDELDEITAQPLLNFLVAMSYERGEVTFDKDTNLNEIYADLLSAVYVRHYVKDERAASERRLRLLSNLKEEHFSRVLQEIAVAAFHGAGRTTSVVEIKHHFEKSNLSKLLKGFIEDAEKGVVSLLAAFYFRQAESNAEGSQTFEFTHKSFGEYLAAVKMVSHLEKASEDLKKHEKDVFGEEGRSVNRCLIDWLQLFGPKELDTDIIKFLRNELLLLHQNVPENLISLQEVLVQMINVVLVNDMPMEELKPRLNSFKKELNQSKAAIKSLFIFHSLISNLTQRISDVQWPHMSSLSNLSHRLSEPLGTGRFSGLYLSNFKAQDQLFAFNGLLMTDFSNSDLTGAIFNHSSLLFSIFNNSLLSNGEFQSANVRHVQFLNANLEGANLEGANLGGANLTDANLGDANLTNTNLYGAIFTGANIEGVKWDKGALEKLKKNGQI